MLGIILAMRTRGHTASLLLGWRTSSGSAVARPGPNGLRSCGERQSVINEGPTGQTDAHTGEEAHEIVYRGHSSGESHLERYTRICRRTAIVEHTNSTTDP